MTKKERIHSLVYEVLIPMCYEMHLYAHLPLDNRNALLKRMHDIIDEPPPTPYKGLRVPERVVKAAQKMKTMEDNKLKKKPTLVDHE